VNEGGRETEGDSGLRCQREEPSERGERPRERGRRDRERRETKGDTSRDIFTFLGYSSDVWGVGAHWVLPTNVRSQLRLEHGVYGARQLLLEVGVVGGGRGLGLQEVVEDVKHRLWWERERRERVRDRGERLRENKGDAKRRHEERRETPKGGALGRHQGRGVHRETERLRDSKGDAKR